LRDEAFFVVIMMTPLPACEPYRADAAGPFSTEMFSMSSGLMLEMPSPKSYPPSLFALPKLVLSMGIPSTTYSGWLFPVSIELPRISTREEPLGPPAVWLMIRPGSRPASELMTFSSRTFSNASPLMSPTEYPSDLRSRVMPSAVTTTSWIVSLVVSSLMARLVWVPTLTSAVL